MGEPLIQVQVLEKTGRRGQVKVRRLSEPHAGLEEFVRTHQLLVPWGERQAMLKDVERAQRFAKQRPQHNQALSGAIRTAMVASGYSDASAEDDGTVHMEATELREIARQAGLPQNLEDVHEAAYVDRCGEMHLPVEVAEQLAHAYAVAEPEIVLMYIEDVESEYKAKGYEPGKRYYHDLLREEMPGFALARYWAGHEEEIAQLRVEIERLRKLVVSAAEVLEKAGQERDGWRLRRALGGQLTTFVTAAAARRTARLHLVTSMGGEWPAASQYISWRTRLGRESRRATTARRLGSSTKSYCLCTPASPRRCGLLNAAMLRAIDRPFSAR